MGPKERQKKAQREPMRCQRGIAAALKATAMKVVVNTWGVPSPSVDALNIGKVKAIQQ